MAAIEVSNLSKQYPFYRKQPGLAGTLKTFFHRTYELRHAVQDISFTIQPGELVGFLGPNGAGKTTTLKMLSGIIEPTSGRVRVLGFDPRKGQNEYKRRFGMVMGQKNQLMQQLPALDGFRLIQALYNIPDADYKQNRDELIETLGAQDYVDIQVRKLSLGQRMKCELIAALLHQPEILLLDEPTIGLDVIAQKNIREFIKRYNETHHTTIMLTSHYMEDIEELCKRVIIIDRGSILYDGDLDKLIKQYAPYKVIKATFTKGVAAGDLQQIGTVVDHQPFSATIRVPREQATAAAARLLTSNTPIDDILIDEEDIDEIIRTVFRGSEA